MSVVRVSPKIVEFFNSNHSKSDGKFTSGGGRSSNGFNSFKTKLTDNPAHVAIAKATDANLAGKPIHRTIEGLNAKASDVKVHRDGTVSIKGVTTLLQVKGSGGRYIVNSGYGEGSPSANRVYKGQIALKAAIARSTKGHSAFTSGKIEEFYNSHHAKSDGRFTSGGSGGTDWHRVGTDSKYASERGMSLPVLPGKAKHIPFTPTTAAQNAQFRQERADLAKNGGKSKTSPDAPTYKGQAAIRRALSKASNKFGQSGGFEFTLKDGTRTEIGVQRTTNTHVYGNGGFGEYRIAFKDIASAKPLGIAFNNARSHLPFKAATEPHTQDKVRPHTTPNFIDTGTGRHIKSIDDWTAKFPNGNRHPTGVTGKTTVKVKVRKK